MRTRATTLVLALGLLVPVGVTAQQTAAATPSTRPIRKSWFADRKSLEVGDIITVFVDEVTLAQANKSVIAQRDKDRNFQFGSFGGIDLRHDVTDRTRGESTNRNRFSAEMSARITEITPSGTARIEGVKTLQIDEHEQLVVLRGWIRTQDVSTQNTLESWRIADAEILYTTNGELGKPRRGFLSKILDMIIP